MLIRRLWYLFVLTALLALAYYLPKAVQNTEGFAPLATQMADQLASHTPTPAALVFEPSPPPAGIPEPTPVVEDAPAPVAKTEPVAETPPAMADASKPADLTPFVEAMALGDFAKAAALLELLKSGLAPEKYSLLAANVETARKREAAAVPAPAPAAPVVVAAPKPDPVAVQAQAAMLESLRMIQQTQKETAQMLAQLREKPTALAASAPPVTNAAPPAAPDTSGPLPGSLTILFGRDSSIINPVESEKLRPALEALKSNPNLKVELRGFADKSGSSEYNLGLSRARAMAVQDVFRRASIEGDRVVLMPMGDFPASDATAGESASAMRKVEVILVR